MIGNKVGRKEKKKKRRKEEKKEKKEERKEVPFRCSDVEPSATKGTLQFSTSVEPTAQIIVNKLVS